MRKFFLFSALAAFAILGCNGSGDMPCVDCAEPFPYSPSSPSGIPNQSGSSSSSSWQQPSSGYCLYYGGACKYVSISECKEADYYGDDETCGNNGKSPPIDNHSSSSSGGIPVGPSSPSNASSSSEQSGVISGQPVRYGEETYETVVIGAQTWMARNLNLYNNETCTASNNYCVCGISYDWATAMALDKNCNNSGSCLSTGMGTPKYQGICPPGWHIPSNADWNTLKEAVGNASLKALSTWWNGGNPPGGDKYGFAALPCGYMDETEFLGFGDFAGWWSSTEEKNYAAHLWSITSKGGNISQFSENKSYGHNVRCVKD